ncbi:hypothetical protein BHE74_00041615 [Ensete ventricosum]|nr:hypothetical protein GW17_00031837 [Ensete ventricosum]RWW51993.1 hypothetical protein BHE74_00041615 [Ensete ventricosum]
MVCEKCEKKLAKVIVPDKWKEGASNTTESGGRKINENKLLSKKNRSLVSPSFLPSLLRFRYGEETIHQQRVVIPLISPDLIELQLPIAALVVDMIFFISCEGALARGVCAMCGKQVLDTKLYKQSNV